MAHNHNHEYCDSSCGCEHDHTESSNKGQFIFKISAGGFFLVAGYIFEELAERGIIELPDFVYLVCFLLSYLIVGFDIVKEAVQGIIGGDIFNENLLMSIASIGAFAIKEYGEGCAVVFLYTVGEFLQGLAVEKSRKAIKSTAKAMPSAVCVLRDGEESAIPPKELKIGDLMILRPGEMLSTDAIMLDGTAQFDMKLLTGEAIPVTKFAGDSVPAGSVCLDASVKLKVQKEYGDSAVSNISDMLDASQAKKTHAQKFITRFAKIYTPAVCLVAVLIMLVPPLFFGGDLHEWLYRGLSALVVSCPCALVISIPLGFFAGIASCSRKGVLVKGGNNLEALAKADAAVFDKTSALTSGKFEHVTCEHINCRCEDNNHRELLKIIAACEKHSSHPTAKLISVAFGHYADGCDIKDEELYPGMGVGAVVDGVKYYVGSERLMREHCPDFKESSISGTPVYCCKENEFLGDIVFEDIIKEDSKKMIASLKRLGIGYTAMTSDDKETVASQTAERAGLDCAYSRLNPNEKTKLIKQLHLQGKTVIYVGDAINDAPVLAQADVGVAMGANGSDIAAQAADIVVIGDSAAPVAAAKKTANRTVKIVYENIIFAIAVKLLIIIGCAVGIFDENAMWLAVFGDVGVCLIAIANSLRALK